MQTFFVIAILVFGFLITFQIAKASEYVAVLRGEERSRKQSNRVNAFMLLAFLIVGLIGVYYCNVKLKDKIMERVVITLTMPQNNKTGMTPEERNIIRCWIEQGASIK